MRPGKPTHGVMQPGMKFSLKPLPIEGLTSKTANDFYQLNELIRDQLEAGNFAEAIQETLPTTPQMFPDGRVVYGVDGATAIVSAVFGSTDFSFGPISNNFRYRPLDHKMVVAFSVITWTIIDHEHRTVRTLETAQTELFRRNNHRPRGWEQIYEQFAYVTPVARRALRPSKPEKNNVFAPSDVLAWKCLEKPRFFSWLVTVW